MENQNQDQKQDEDWRTDIKKPSETLKIQPDETVIVEFLDEGKINRHQDFGVSIVFSVRVLDQPNERSWYVSKTNYDLLGQIKELGTLTGKKVKISRKGASRSETRYKIEKI